jgi:HTH-type transcriptional regulator/antitoxin HigA
MNATPRVVRSEAQLREYLEEIERLAAIDPPVNSPEEERLSLLALLVEAYEKELVDFPVPDPRDAIIFRMAEQGLKQKDLVPFIGSKGKVSEVLSGTRPLSIRMIRALSDGLGIPAKVLVAEPKDSAPADELDFSRFPFREMAKRGWLDVGPNETTKDLIASVENFFKEVCGHQVGYACFRRSMHIGGDVSTNFYGLNAWLARVLVASRESTKFQRLEYQRPSDVPGYLRSLAQLSWSETGPLLAVEYLAKSGIAVVIEPHLSKTHLDGAALLDRDGTPVIGMSLRYDRLDNFWFTLLHEAAHVLCHLESDQEAFVDNTQEDPDGERKEIEANRLAQEALIPRSVWSRSHAYRRPSKETVLELAEELRIHPAIVAGRVRRETGNYKKFTNLIGNRQVKSLFSAS